MQWLIRIISLAGRLLDRLRKTAVQALLLLVYVFGLGPLGLWIRVREAAGGGEGPGLQPIEPGDAGSRGLELMY